MIKRPVTLSLNEIDDRNPHFVNPSAVPQTLLTVSGKVCLLSKMVYKLSVNLTDMVVVDAKGVVGFVVKKEGLNDEVVQSQSARAPNPQNTKLLIEDYCSAMISLP